MKKRTVLIILDGIGIGALPDAGDYGDENANTLKHISRKVGGFNVQNLERLGLGNLGDFLGIKKCTLPIGGFGKMVEKSSGKESVIGHWEITGVISKEPFPVYPNGFPSEIIEEFEKAIGLKTIGNVQMTGSQLIEKMENEHLKTKLPIVYSAQDSSCFQVAAHEDLIPLDELYQMCEKAKKILLEKRLVARVVAKPFHGKPGSPVKSNLKRKDYVCPPLDETILDRITSSGVEVIGIGRVGELYGNRGISKNTKTGDNTEALKVTIDCLEELSSGLIYITLKDFDSIYGHSRNYEGFKGGLELFDKKLGLIVDLLQSDDLLLITADHGLDSTLGTDHTREYVPLMAYGKQFRPGVNLKTRDSFADVGQTILDFFNIPPMPTGKSFLDELSN